MVYQERRLNLLVKMDCSIAEALERILNDEEMLLTCITMVLEDEGFEALGRAIQKENAKEAFEIAHSLKGITGNTGLDPLYITLCKMVEAFRINSFYHCDEWYKELLLKKETLEQIMK